MLKILFADTDTDNIKNFKTYIRLSFPEFKVVGSIRAPSSFLQELNTLQPNLIVADMRFFGANAYQIIRDTYEYFADIRFILYGTYNDVEYMERVMEFGVIDYMYRPVKPHEFERCLNRAVKMFERINKMNEEKERLITDYKGKINIFKDKFLMGLLHGNLINEFEIKNSLKYFGINITPDYSVFTIRIDRYKKILLTMDDIEKHLLIYKILLIIEEKLLKLENGVAVINGFNSVVAILGNSIELPEIIALCNDLKIDISNQCRIGVSAGIGRAYKNASDICISFKEAEAALRYRHYVGYNSVIPLHFVEPLNNITYRYPIEKEDALVYSAVAGEYEYCESLIKQLIQALKESGDIPEKLASKIVLNIIVSINRFTVEQHLVQDVPFNEFFPSKEVFQMESLDDAYNYLTKTLKKYCEYMNEIRSKTKLELLEKAKSHISVKYYENITLSHLSNSLNTTSEFLSNIFLEYEKKSLYEYIISIRMQNAKRIMRESNDDDEIIALKIGYQDVKHFRSVFKQYEGIFTHEYRNRFNINSINFRNSNKNPPSFS